MRMGKASKNIIEEILGDKTIKAKEKVSLISQLLLDGKVSVQHLISTGKHEGDSNTATIMESLEHASKIKADIMNEQAFEFAIQGLRSDAARIKWESARVIANSAHLFPKVMKKAVVNLLANAEYPGTVVRWSAAGALSKIIQCKTNLNKDLIPAVETIEKKEEDKAIKKIYRQVLNKAAK